MKRILWFSILILTLLAISIQPGFAQNAKGRASRIIPQAVPETNSTDVRVDKYGDVYTLTVGKKHTLADEGSYYVITSAAATSYPGAGTITSFAQTAGDVGVTMLLKNTEPAGGKRVFFDYVKLLTSVVPTAVTSLQYALVLDDNPLRYTSGGTALTPVSPNADNNLPSITQAYFGRLTTAVPAHGRTVGRGTLRGVVPTVFDVLTILSGGSESGGSMASAAASGRQTDVTAPIIIGPGQNLCLTLWGASYTTAAEWEFEIGFWER
jgi:hypothetical protein